MNAELKDVSGIIELLKANELPVSDISFDKQQFWVEIKNEIIIGVCAIEQYDDYALLRSFAVKKEFQNKGIGKTLYNNVLKACIDKDISCLFLLTTTAKEYFNKKGWSSVSRMAVPLTLKQSSEFNTMCPQSAECMMLILNNDRSKKAVSTFNNNYNCAQSVLSVNGKGYGLSEDILLRISTGLGAGIGFKGNVCGAVTGAYLTIGLKYGKGIEDNDLAKEITYSKMMEFDKEFVKYHGSIYCTDLLNGNVGNEKELDKILHQQLFAKACPVYVYTASKILNKIIKHNNERE